MIIIERGTGHYAIIANVFAHRWVADYGKLCRGSDIYIAQLSSLAVTVDFKE